MNRKLERLILFLKFNSLIGKNLLILTNVEEYRKFLIEFGVKKHKNISLNMHKTNTEVMCLEYKKRYIFISYQKTKYIKKKFNYKKFNIIIGLNRKFYFDKMPRSTLNINWDFPLAEQ